jgi:hypothetical protein
MSMDADLRDILREHEPNLLALARKAYEHGFREGLARAGGPAIAAPVAAAPPPAAVVSAPPSPVAAPARPPPLFAENVDPPEEADDPGGDEPEDDEPNAEARPVRSSITVGGLVKKITRHFGLDRFNIEIRVVDPRSHRHLMRNVRLSRYVIEEA